MLKYNHKCGNKLQTVGDLPKRSAFPTKAGKYQLSTSPQCFQDFRHGISPVAPNAPCYERLFTFSRNLGYENRSRMGDPHEKYKERLILEESSHRL